MRSGSIAGLWGRGDFLIALNLLRRLWRVAFLEIPDRLFARFWVLSLEHVYVYAKWRLSWRVYICTNAMKRKLYWFGRSSGMGEFREIGEPYHRYSSIRAKGARK